MKSEPGFASGSSSIGIRVRSQRKIGDEVCELMNSSGSSLGLSAEIEEIKNAAMGETSPLPEGGGSSPVGPISGIGVEEVAFWRQKLHLSENLVIRIPGFRDQVPSLIAEVSRAVNISPGQLNSPVWRILIAMQNLGDLEELRSSNDLVDSAMIVIVPLVAWPPAAFIPRLVSLRRSLRGRISVRLRGAIGFQDEIFHAGHFREFSS
ncbi:hypothetical protein F2Q69_00053261 [Brassica cretica]|uniref:Uncharacterized protein n=1 Tax=Brassica cretica TaxID=69181 RepID=A0A8S9MTI6_BRACR|nr:hypothetical protein F2Q69_00053261 [Brassica cretica]